MIYSVYLSFGSNLSSKFGSPVDNIKQAYLELLKYGFKIKKNHHFIKVLHIQMLMTQNLLIVLHISHVILK